MSINYKLIGKNIKAARLRNNLTQERLAEIADVSITHISNIETSRTKVGLSTLIRIANSLSLTADELFYGNIDGCNITPHHKFHSLFANCSDDELSLLFDYVKAGKDILKKAQELKQE